MSGGPVTTFTPKPMPSAGTYVYEDVARQDILAMVPPDGRVIGSVGCGPGRTEERLVEQGREVHGVDVSPEAVALAAPRLTSARVVAAGERGLFAPESLDGLILADVIEHMPAAWDALREFAGYVRPGGWVVVSVPNMRNLDVLRRFVWGGDWPEEPTGVFDATHLQVMSPARLDRWCRDAGLRVVDRHDFYLQPSRRTYRLYRALDKITFRRFHSWFLLQVKVVCRKPNRPAGAGGGAG